MTGPAAIPPEAVTAAALALRRGHERFGVRLPANDRRALAAEVLEAAEAAWPHDPPRRSAESTTAARADLGPGRKPHNRYAPSRDDPVHPFGFGPPEVTA